MLSSKSHTADLLSDETALKKMIYQALSHANKPLAIQAIMSTYSIMNLPLLRSAECHRIFYV